MADTYLCVTCKKTRPGRFTRRRTDGSGGWDKGYQLPCWYCWTCLKPGEGRDETKDTMPKTPTPAVIDITPDDKKEQTKALAVISGLAATVEELTVTTPTQYATADLILGDIRQARKGWKTIWDRIQEKTIQPIRRGLEGLYEVNRAVDGPMEKLEGAVKVKMREYKIEEQRQIDEANAATEREQRRLAREAEERRKAAETAATPQMKGRLQAAANRLDEQAETVASQPAPARTFGQASSTRTKPAWRIKNYEEFIAGWIDGTLPQEVLMVNKAEMDQQFKDDPEGMKAWPGVEVYNDVQIVGR